MKHPITFLINYLQGKQIYHHLRNEGSVYYEQRLSHYANKPILNTEETTAKIISMLEEGNPFMIARFGATELATMKTFDFEVHKRYQAQLSRAHLLSGIFPETEETGRRFSQQMIQWSRQADLMGIWPQPFEEYYLKKYGSTDLALTWLRSLEPWQTPGNPWTRALKGKKVLVVHPFTESIERQYQKREQLFQGTEILPEFELQTFKSVQTAAGEKDERFSTWFEALDWMNAEIQKRDFDVAILGCGAYGFPLAAEIKRSGRQAIHLGGITQVLFGILGARWDDDPAIQNYVNDAWTRPAENERPKKAEAVEHACYW